MLVRQLGNWDLNSIVDIRARMSSKMVTHLLGTSVPVWFEVPEQG